LDKKMTQEEMVKEAVEEAKKAAEEQDAAQEAAGEDTEAVAEETVEEEADSEASEEEALEETAEEGSEKGAKGLFKRKPKKDKKDEQIEELKDKLTRQMAEFDNFRKRTEKEKSAMYEIGAKDIIEKILPVVDNFERGLGAVTEEQKEDSFVAGMEMIYKQIMTTLDSVGVKAIEAVGNEFDPDFHNAVMHVEDEEVGENIVVEEFQKGYTYRDTVVRHSMVKVAN
jgi:molecular chaperone GrpE